MLIEPANQTLITQKNYRSIVMMDYFDSVGSYVC